jgi:peptide/nickel transport system ATP-binding protein
MSGTAPLLSIGNLHVCVRQGRRQLPILRGADLALERQSIHGLVGESGGGKTMVSKAILGLLPESVQVTSGSMRFKDLDLLKLNEAGRRALLGKSITTILQNPMTALNPVLSVDTQMTDVLRYRLGMSRGEARRLALDMLVNVHIRDPERVMRLYPHELSGGMCQRIAIAIAFACEPELVLADEPTTALDVTVQFQILRLIRDMQRRFKTTVLFVTHDLGVVAKLCDRVSVIFAGRILETKPASELFARPEHAYTQALIGATPRYDRPAAALTPVPPALHAQLWADAHAYDVAHGYS